MNELKRKLILALASRLQLTSKDVADYLFTMKDDKKTTAIKYGNWNELSSSFRR